MPESDRGGSSKTRLIVAASIAVTILLIASVGVGLFYQHGYEQEAANNARQYARETDQKVAETCRGVPAAQFPHCFAEARAEGQLEKRQAEHDQADLIAQRKAALWTSIMGIAALLGMGLSVVGVVVVWFTFRETRRGNEIQRRIGEAQTRSYISVTEAFADLSEEKVPQIGFTLKNSGQSPALKMRLKVTLTLHLVPEKGKPKSFEAVCKLGGIYSVPATDTLNVPAHGLAKPPAAFLDFKHLQGLVLIEYEWDDVFETRHPGKEVFAFLIQEWPGAPFWLESYHSYLATMENDKLRRMAKGEWKDKKP